MINHLILVGSERIGTSELVSVGSDIISRFIVCIFVEGVFPGFFKVNPKCQLFPIYEDSFDIVPIWNRNDNGFIAIIDHLPQIQRGADRKSQSSIENQGYQDNLGRDSNVGKLSVCYSLEVSDFVLETISLVPAQETEKFLIDECFILKPVRSIIYT